MMTTQRLTPLAGNTQKLDGGAMFGNVPKALWGRWIAADAQNRITLACRALLIQDAHKTVLLETGIGNFFEPKLKERYGVVEDTHVLLASLGAAGLADTDIDIVILSHLHFDHAGGLLAPWRDGRPPQLLFPRARYLVGKKHWERACHPHLRDKASFVPPLNALLEHSGRLDLIEGERVPLLGDAFRFFFTDGHTPGLLHTVVQAPIGPIIFISDLIPGLPWVHLPVTMGYDRFPEQLIDEKQRVLEEAVQTQAYLFFTHDPEMAAARIACDGTGRFSPVGATHSFAG